MSTIFIMIKWLSRGPVSDLLPLFWVWDLESPEDIMPKCEKTRPRHDCTNMQNFPPISCCAGEKSEAGQTQRESNSKLSILTHVQWVITLKKTIMTAATLMLWWNVLPCSGVEIRVLDTSCVVQTTCDSVLDQASHQMNTSHQQKQNSPRPRRQDYQDIRQSAAVHWTYRHRSSTRTWSVGHNNLLPTSSMQLSCL